MGSGLGHGRALGLVPSYQTQSRSQPSAPLGTRGPLGLEARQSQAHAEGQQASHMFTVKPLPASATLHLSWILMSCLPMALFPLPHPLFFPLADSSSFLKTLPSIAPTGKLPLSVFWLPLLTFLCSGHRAIESLGLREKMRSLVEIQHMWRGGGGVRAMQPLPILTPIFPSPHFHLN